MCIYVGFVIVIISTFDICSVGYKSIEYGNVCGEAAKLGVCKKLSECPPAVKSVIKTRSHPFQRCGFIDRDEIICCPDFKTAQSLNNHSSTDDERIWGKIVVSRSKPTPIILRNSNGDRKSEIACKEYVSNTKIGLGLQITSGFDASVGEFPHMAQIGYGGPSRTNSIVWKCGGSLIHPQFVLTAAHCLQKAFLDPPKIVRFGFVDSDLPGNSNSVVKRYVKNYTLHPEYNGIFLLNDIAVIELAHEVTKNDANVYPACLYQKNDDPMDLIITGWGYITTDAESPSKILQKAYTDPSDLENCAKMYERNRLNTSTQICCVIPNNPADTCQGDSGGPLQLLASEIKNVYVIVGVTSFGGGDCGDGKTPGVYTRVSSYLDWIESIVWP